MTYSEKIYDALNSVKKAYPQELSEFSFSILNEYRVGIRNKNGLCFANITVDGITFRLFCMLAGETKMDYSEETFYDNIKWSFGFAANKQLT